MSRLVANRMYEMKLKQQLARQRGLLSSPLEIGREVEDLLLTANVAVIFGPRCLLIIHIAV